MITKELVEYIKTELSLGTSYDALKAKIIKTGWAEEDFNEAMRALHPEPVVMQKPIVQPLPVQPAPVVNTPVVTTPITPHIEPVQNPVMTQTQFPAVQPAVMPVTLAESAPTIQPQPVLVTEPVVLIQTHASPKRKIIIIALIVLVLLLIAGVVYGYVGGYFESLATVTQKAFLASHDAKTASFDMTVTVDTSGLQKQPDAPTIPGLSADTFTFNMKGVSDNTDPNNLKFDSTVSFNAGSLAGELLLRRVSGVLYGNLTKAPSIGFVSLAPFQNKWFSFPATQTPDQTNQAMNAMLPTTVDPHMFDSLTKEQQDHIYALAQNDHFITITKRLAPEKVNGTLSYHFVFTLDQNGLTTYIKDVTDYIHSISATNPQLSTFDTTSLVDSIGLIRDFNGEAWIGVWDHLPHKVTANFGIVEKGNESAGQIKITSTALFDNWNKPVTVTVPADSVPFQTFVSGIFAQMGITPPPTDSASAPTGPDAEKQSILSSMRAQAGTYYDVNHNSYANLCTTSNGLLPLAKNLPPNTEYKCKSIASMWIALAKLTTPPQYFCVDSTGFAGNVPSIPSSFACERP